MIYFVAILCVFGMAIGQILFKLSASYLVKTGTFFSFKPALFLILAMSLYALTSVAWVWILQRIELGKVYPLMALAFIFVPIGSYLVFGETFHMKYIFGVALIVSGIFLAVSN
jgi:EamA-like transporter family.